MYKSSRVMIGMVLAVALSACGTTAPVKQPVVTNQVAIGAIKLTYDSNGEMVKMVSTGVAPLAGRSAHAVSVASKVAQLRAKQNIVEYMRNDIRVNTEAGLTSTSKANSDSENVNSDNIEVVTQVTENIKANSQAVLRGVMLTDQEVTQDSVMVEVTVTRQSMEGAAAASKMFGGR